MQLVASQIEILWEMGKPRPPPIKLENDYSSLFMHTIRKQWNMHTLTASNLLNGMLICCRTYYCHMKFPVQLRRNAFKTLNSVEIKDNKEK